MKRWKYLLCLGLGVLLAALALAGGAAGAQAAPSSGVQVSRSAAPPALAARAAPAINGAFLARGGPGAAALNCSLPTPKSPCDLQVFMLIDDSGSMLYSDPTRQRYEGVRNVLDILAKEYYLPALDAHARDASVKLPKVEVTFIHFSSKLLYSSDWRPVNPKDLPDWDKQLKGFFDTDLNIKVNYNQEQNTDFRLAFDAAAKRAAQDVQVKECPRLVMLFTDGVPNFGNGDLRGAALDQHMDEVKKLITPVFNRPNDFLYVTAFESSKSAAFWSDRYRQKWEGITGPGTPELPATLYVPTQELAVRMERIVAATVQIPDYILSPLPGKPTQYRLEVLPLVEALRLTYFTSNASATFTVTTPDGKVIQPDGQNATLSGAGTSIQVLEIKNPAPGTYTLATSLPGGVLTQLVRFQKVSAKLASPLDPLLIFTTGQIAIQLVGADGAPLATQEQFVIQASLAQAGKSSELNLSREAQAYTAGWMPLTLDEADLSACALLVDGQGKTVDVLYNGPVGVITVDPLGLDIGSTAGVCVPVDKPQTQALQLINKRTAKPAAIELPLQWSVHSTSTPGGGTVESSVEVVDAKAGRYALHFTPTSAGDVVTDLSASVSAEGTTYTLPLGQATASGYTQTRSLSFKLGGVQKPADSLSTALYGFFFGVKAGPGVQVLYGRHWFGWFGPDTVQVSGKFVDAASGADEPGIERFEVQLVSQAGGQASERSHAWQKAGAENTLTLKAPGLGLFSVTATDTGSNPACTTLASLPTQGVLLVNDAWEYILILILILLLLIVLILIWLFLLRRRRLWGVLAILDREKQCVIWQERLGQKGEREQTWEFAEPKGDISQLHIATSRQAHQGVALQVKSAGVWVSFDDALLKWEDYQLPSGLWIAWRREKLELAECAPQPQPDPGPGPEPEPHYDPEPEHPYDPGPETPSDPGPDIPYDPGPETPSDSGTEPGQQPDRGPALIPSLPPRRHRVARKNGEEIEVEIQQRIEWVPRQEGDEVLVGRVVMLIADTDGKLIEVFEEFEIDEEEICRRRGA